MAASQRAWGNTQIIQGTIVRPLKEAVVLEINGSDLETCRMALAELKADIAELGVLDHTAWDSARRVLSVYIYRRI
jgi:hypothetical protein